MSQRKSERQRWVQVFELPRPSRDSTVDTVRAYYDQLDAVVRAFDKVGRVIRVVPNEYGNGFIVFKARRS